MRSTRSPADSAPLDFLPPDVATGMLLSTVHRRSQKVFNEALRPLGIEERHFATLAVLDGTGPLTQRRLADLLDLDKSSLGRIVDDLERQRLAERRPLPGDRRAHAIHLTEQGRQHVRDGHRIAAQVGRHLFGHLSPRTRAALDHALREVLAAPGADPATPGDESRP
ncbi:MarR family winged helix-turn-helix transcriptional regulator [Micromonospora sp. HM5-17]|jgi:DNA-binding MarR family transcriptional regulator|uniref:MarR family winged helix-turn-helix transcriptional regulator n=1 Tax=Micromonospora sp. HM5-17 TaxID=2487710 RepID=UPI000F46F284|nr:MarR family winged helix-turn-helix transcriptional regulator [Micromonospora sp. HM5-17]ROT31168.1 MarR family transcriptional regulator [Micromonospora sp. HM5-17]